ncbi:MAG: TPM domain-containing protein [Ruminococcus sp.]|nr:TPM domain-containing protein [Ruminococcus sp.]
MKITFKSILTALSAAAVMAVSAVAAGAESLIPAHVLPDEQLKPRVVDAADFLTDSEEEALLDRLDSLSEKLGVDVVVVSTPDLEDYISAEAFTDDYYDYNGFNVKDSEGGICLMVTDGEAGNRDYHISTTGKMIGFMNKKGRLSKLQNAILPYLKSSDFNGAFNKFADTVESMDKKSRYPGIGWVVAAAVVGLLSGLIYCSKQKSQLTTVKMQANANDYIKQGSFMITANRDQFLYRDVSRTYIERSSGSGGGGSHTGSSGISHGGGGGKF